MTMQIQAATYEMPDGSQEVELSLNGIGQLRFTAEQLSEHIQILSNIRETLVPTVPMEAPPMQNFQHVAVDPPIRWAYDEMNDAVALLMRHPGHGWIGSLVPVRSAEALQHGLQEVIEHRNAQRRTPN